MLYANDARSAHFEMSLNLQSGGKEEEKVVDVGKEAMAELFRQLERIQDEVNSYM